MPYAHPPGPAAHCHLQPGDSHMHFALHDSCHSDFGEVRGASVSASHLDSPLHATQLSGACPLTICTSQ